MNVALQARPRMPSPLRQRKFLRSHQLSEMEVQSQPRAETAATARALPPNTGSGESEGGSEEGGFGEEGARTQEKTDEPISRTVTDGRAAVLDCKSRVPPRPVPFASREERRGGEVENSHPQGPPRGYAKRSEGLIALAAVGRAGHVNVGCDSVGKGPGSGKAERRTKTQSLRRTKRGRGRGRGRAQH